MKNQILKALNAKLKDQDNATDRYEYRTAIFDCIKIIEAQEPPIPKIVVWKDGTSKAVMDGITHEYENDDNWLTTVSF